ncbi:conjugal transfer protein [Serratia nevei]|nr:conjugal transfer protein [Serratia nevei]
MSKLSKLFLVLMLSGMSVSTCYASACETLVCMAGKAGVGSSGGSSCDGPIKDFFDIVKFKRGSFKGGATADARKAFLMSCDGASENKAIVDTIISKFGKTRV